MRLAILMPIVLATALAGPLRAQSVQDTTDLDRIVAEFTGVPVGEPGGARGPVDPRLRLAPCPVEPVAGWFGSGHASVKLGCPVAGGWSVYVPLVQATATEAVIARGDLVSVELKGRGFVLASRGEALSAGMPGATIAVRLVGQDPRSKGIMAKVVGLGKVGMDLP